MTTERDNFNKMVWDSLPRFRKMVVGRERIDDLIEIVVEQCPCEYVAQVSHKSCEEAVVSMAWTQSVKRSYCLLYGEEVTIGPIFWILIAPLLQLMITKILEWWWESRNNRTLMILWNKEAGGQ